MLDAVLRLELLFGSAHTSDPRSGVSASRVSESGVRQCSHAPATEALHDSAELPVGDMSVESCRALPA